MVHQLNTTTTAISRRPGRSKGCSTNTDVSELLLIDYLSQEDTIKLLKFMSRLASSYESWCQATWSLHCHSIADVGQIEEPTV